MLLELTENERLLLLRFVCAFAWADLEIREQEREFVARLVDKLGLAADEREQVQRWLASGVPPEDVDPNHVPRRHRELFLSCAREIINVDGEVDPNEADNLALLEQLLGVSPSV
jgi:uncharacterized tellurite resistance protein B-like protein